MRLLILTAFYPIPGKTHERMFVHVRNKYYQEHGADVTVLNFAAKECYEVDGIKVITLEKFEEEHSQGDKSCGYDVAISHSANVRNHYKFLKKYEQEFKHLVFFFHGHETSIFAKDYPKPYGFTSDGKLGKRAFQFAYDIFKLKVWRKFYIDLADKSEYIFVSDSFFKRVQKNLRVAPQDLKNHCHVIHNSVGGFFETADYESSGDKGYDFISIRSNLDAPKYGVDLYVELAKRCPEKKFLLIGKGEIFKHMQMPPNMAWINHTLDHQEMVSYLNNSRCGIMLTRSDTQGVMTCEMATFGMPVISSDIDVCQEILSCFPNVKLINNSLENVSLEEICDELENGRPYEKCKKYFAENTIAKEMDLYSQIVNKTNVI